MASASLSLACVSPSFASMAVWAAVSSTLIPSSTSTAAARSWRSTRRDDVFSTTDRMYTLPTEVRTELATADKNLFWTSASKESFV